MAHNVYEVDFNNPQADVIGKAADVLFAHGVVLFPCDTNYRIGALPQKDRVLSAKIEQIFSFNLHAGGPSYPWLVPSVDSLDRCGRDVSDEAHKLAEAFWPGGLSLVVPASLHIPKRMVHVDGTLSMRMSSSPVVQALLEIVKTPIVSTKASRHGVPSPRTFEAVSAEIIDLVGVALNASNAECKGRSTIIDCSRGQARILRCGVVSAEEIDEVLGCRIPIV